MFLRGRLEKYEMKERGREKSRIGRTTKSAVCPHASVCVCECVFALKREDSCAEYTGRGETLFLPSSYFLQNSCVCLWEGGGREKKGRKGNYILTLPHMLFFPPTHTYTRMYGFWWTAIKFSPLVYCQSDYSVKCLCQSRLSPRGWEWHRHPCSCQLACVRTCGMMTELRIAKSALLDGALSSSPSKPFLQRRCLSDVSIFPLLEVRDSFRSS